MSVIQVSAPNSIQKQVNYNVNQKVLAKTQGAVPGLEDEIREYPKSIAGLFKKSVKSDSGYAFIGFDTIAQNAGNIQAGKGFIMDASLNIYYLEQLILMPTPESFWGFYELELLVEDSDEVTLEFVNPSTVPKTFYTSNAFTKKKYTVKIYENYNTTASFPTLTPGRIKWMEYKKTAPFGTITDSTNYLESALILNSEIVDSLIVSDSKKPLSAKQGKLLQDQIPAGTVSAWDKYLTGTPSLSGYFAEANGQVISDPESPYNGKRIRNLNGKTVSAVSILVIDDINKIITVNTDDIAAFGIGDTLSFTGATVPDAVVKAVNYSTGQITVGDVSAWDGLLSVFGLTAGSIAGASAVTAVGQPRFLKGRDTQGSAVNKTQGSQVGGVLNGNYYYGSVIFENQSFSASAQVDNSYVGFTTVGQGVPNKLTNVSDAVHGVPRTGMETEPDSQNVVWIIKIK